MMFYVQKCLYMQVLIVAGGVTGYIVDQIYDYLDSTEKLVLLPGDVWTTTTPLPRKLNFMGSVSINNRIYLLGINMQSCCIVVIVCIAGGWDGTESVEIVVVLEYGDGEDWKEVGEQLKPRTSFGATIVKIDTNMMNMCNQEEVEAVGLMKYLCIEQIYLS